MIDDLAAPEILQIAAKIVLVNDKGKIILLRESAAHETNTKAGRYHLPGGRIELGETFFEGLTREVMEETSLTIEIGKPLLVDEWRPKIKGIRHQIIGVYMSGRIAHGKAQLSHEHDRILWINPKEWEKYDIVTPDRDAVAAFAAPNRT